MKSNYVNMQVNYTCSLPISRYATYLCYNTNNQCVVSECNLFGCQYTNYLCPTATI